MVALWTAALACGMEGRAAALAAALEVVMAPPAPPLAQPVTGGRPEQTNHTAHRSPTKLISMYRFNIQAPSVQLDNGSAGPAACLADRQP